MILPPRFRVSDVSAYEWPIALRMPALIGGTTVTQLRQVVIRLRIALHDGRSAEGMAAETLATSWFDTTQGLSDEESLDQLRRSIEYAIDAYQGHGPDTAFRHFAASYGGLMAAGRADGLPPLVAGLGPSLLDRAVADALARVLGISFTALVRGNALGVRAHVLAPDLLGCDTDAFLSGLRMPASIRLRHRVGALDPLSASDSAAMDGDDPPQTLEQVLAAYAPRSVTVQLAGLAPEALDRLCRVAGVLGASAAPCQVVIDAGEAFSDAETAAAFLAAMNAEPRLAGLRHALQFILQPVRREAALEQDMAGLGTFAPVALDASDDEVASFVDARRLGYKGVSLRGGKGLYKGLINAMRCAVWNAEPGSSGYFMASEDLLAPVGLGLQQDMMLAGLLGLGHIGRGAPHLTGGFAGRPAAEAEAFLAAHPDVYAREQGEVRLRVAGGEISMASLDVQGFATAVHPETAWMAPMASSAWMAFLTGRSMAS